VVLRRRGAGLTRDSSIHTLGSEEGISGAKEGLFRCHSEEIFNRKNLAICDETQAPFAMWNSVIAQETAMCSAGFCLVSVRCCAD
jgi:hypothetical protein